MFAGAQLLGTPLRLLTSPTRVVGVAPALRDDELLVTQAAQGVSLYSLSSRACVGSWEAPSALRFTHAAQAHSASRTYLVVAEHNTLLGWAEADKEIGKSQGLTFDQPVSALLQSAVLHDCVAAVLIDGSALVLRVPLGASSRSAADVAIATVPAAAGDDLAVWSCLTSLPSATSNVPLPLCLLVLSRSPSSALTLRVRALEPHYGGDGSATAPLISVGVLPARCIELGLPPPAATTGKAAGGGSSLGGKRGATARESAQNGSQRLAAVSGCCIVPATSVGGHAAERGGRDATLALLWTTGKLQLWTVPPPLERGARSSESAAERATPRCSRSLRGFAPSSTTSPWVGCTGLVTPPASLPDAGASSLLDPAPPAGLLSLGASPLVLLLASSTATRNGDAKTPPAPFSLTPRLEPRAWPKLPSAAAGRTTEEPQPMSLASSPALGPANGSGKVVVQLWDARFGMLHAHRRDTADELPAGSRCAVRGAALCGGGSSVALAFDDAVVVLSVPSPHQSFGLVHALNAAVRTAEVLEPEEAAALTRPPLCAAPFVSSVLPAPSRASMLASAEKTSAMSNRGLAGKSAKKKAKTADAAPGFSAGGGASSRWPVLASAAELSGWQDHVASASAHEATALRVLLDPATDAAAFESHLGSFLTSLAEQAAALAAAEEGHPTVAGSNGKLKIKDVAVTPGAAAKASSAGKRKRRDNNGLDGDHANCSNGILTKDGAQTQDNSLARATGSIVAHGAAGGNAGIRAGMSLAAALEGESQPSEGTSCAGLERVGGALNVSAGFVRSVCDRCVREGSAEWLRLLKPLIEAGLLPAGAQDPSLIQALCAERELDMLLAYVRHASDLDAANLLLLLRLALREGTREREAEGLGGDPTRDNETTGVADGWRTLLDLLICAPRNDVFLLEALRWLSPSDALLLLARLSDLFQAFASAWRLGSDGKSDGWRTPAISQLVGWTNVLLDAHASQLLMHAPAHEPLRALGKLARRHVQLCTAMKGLKGYLGQATLKHQQPMRPIPDYSVEILEV